MKALHVIPVRITDVKHFIKHYNLDERQRRGLYGFLASQVGYGGATAVARDLEVSPITVKAGADELKALCESDLNSSEPKTAMPEKQVRRPGGGRKKLTVKYRQYCQTSIPENRPVNSGSGGDEQRYRGRS